MKGMGKSASLFPAGNFPKKRSEKSIKKTFPQDQDCCQDQTKTEYHEQICCLSPTAGQRSILAHAFLFFVKRRSRGSLTVEAAFAVPLVMMVLTAFLSLFTASVAELRLQSAMESVGHRFAYYYFAVESLTGTSPEAGEQAGNDTEEADWMSLIRTSAEGKLAETVSAAVGSIVWLPVSETLVRARVMSEMEGKWIGEQQVIGGRGNISFFGSRYDSVTESIDFLATYELSPPFLPGVSVPITVKSVHRVWSGKRMAGTDTEEDEQIVYYTDYGKVYHTSLGCSYLALSIRSAQKALVGSLRNESGGIYYPCELCGNKAGETVYITSYGDRYHSDKTCSGLKRGIHSVPISEVGDRSCCQKCAARDEKQQ